MFQKSFLIDEEKKNAHTNKGHVQFFIVSGNLPNRAELLDTTDKELTS